MSLTNLSEIMFDKLIDNARNISNSWRSKHKVYPMSYAHGSLFVFRYGWMIGYWTISSYPLDQFAL